MTEETPQYHPKFENEVKSAVVGEKNTIYNYFYYSQEIKTLPDKTGETDEVLPCPYQGLFHFGPEDSEYFFGRTSVVETLVQATQTRHFIPLLGASGSGKSSVVLAGLVPKLQQMGHWQFTHFRPGSDPFHGLSLALVPLYITNQDETDRIVQARKLANHLRQGDIPLADVFAQIQHNFPNDRVLLIADQFEELYTLCAEEATRRSFLDTLINAFPRREQSHSVGAIALSSRLVLTMRADFLGNALSYRAFADMLQNVDLKLGPMNRQELTDVIAKPAEKLGVAFEAGLVERILQDVEAEPGNLPLLEFALTELWQRRQGNQLTHAAYTEIGEVQGALARHADESYGRLNPAEQQQMRRVFIQLVRPGEGAEDTRRLATKAELGDANWALVKQLADDRLVVTSRSETAQETVEVVHEALIRNWGELRGWMVTDREFRAWQERLRGAMAQWLETQRDEGSLLRGAVLVVAEEKLKERPNDLSKSEQEFICESLYGRNRVERDKTRIKQFIQAVMSIALILTSTAAIIAYINYKQTQLALEQVRDEQLLGDRILQLASNRDLPPPPHTIDILAKRYEGERADHIGTDFMGGVYYGIYRIKAGPEMDAFLAFLNRWAPQYYGKLMAAGGERAAMGLEKQFIEVWRTLGNDPLSSSSFSKLQTDFITQTNYKFLIAKLASTQASTNCRESTPVVIDVEKHTIALQAVIFSIAVQYGSSTCLVQEALGDLGNISKRKDTEIITQLYKFRDKLEIYFPGIQSRSNNFARLIRERNRWEQKDAKYILSQEEHLHRSNPPFRN